MDEPTATLTRTAQEDIMSAIFAGMLPDKFWDCQDDLCDCVYQRIGMWTNPYLAETLEVRLCCIWAELQKQYPQFVRVTPAYKDGNAREWVTEARDWDGEAEMPKAIWYRHLARKLHRPVADIRAEYADKDHLRPKGSPKPEPEPVPFFIRFGGDWVQVNLA